jgi:hypothetical protein
MLDESMAEATEDATEGDDPFVIGIHSRFGGRWKDRKRAKDSDVEKVLECAWNMTKALNADFTFSRRVVWLLASDNVERLEALVNDKWVTMVGKDRWDEQGAVVWAPKAGKVEHVIKSVNGSDVDATMRLWLDWFLMSEVHTCTLIRSSFPRTACYVSSRRDSIKGRVQQLVTNWDLGRYPRVIPKCDTYAMAEAHREL